MEAIKYNLKSQITYMEAYTNTVFLLHLNNLLTPSPCYLMLVYISLKSGILIEQCKSRRIRTI